MSGVIDIEGVPKRRYKYKAGRRVPGPAERGYGSRRTTASMYGEGVVRKGASLLPMIDKTVLAREADWIVEPGVYS